MKKVVVILASLFLLSLSKGYSQAPGYMGKRFLVAGELGSIIKPFGALPNHNFSYQLFNFSIRGILDIDYITSRRGSVGFTLNWVNTAMSFNYDSTSYRTVDFETYFADHAQVKGLSYCINFKVFHGGSKGSIAPVGNYSKIGLGLIHYKTVPYVEDLEYLDKTKTERFITPLITYAYGKQRVLFNNGIFRTSVEFGFVPAGLLSWLSLYYGYESSYSLQRDDLRASSNARLASYYLLNFNIGVGFLLPVRQK